MEPREAHVGAKVVVREHHRDPRLRGVAGEVVGRYGRNGCVALDVRFRDGRQRLVWPRDLEEVEAPRPWWSPLLRGLAGSPGGDREVRA